RQGPYQPLERHRHRDARRGPGRLANGRLDRLRGGFPQLRPNLDYQWWRRLPYVTCWPLADRCATGAVCACRRASWAHERRVPRGQGEAAGRGPRPLHRAPKGRPLDRSRSVVGGRRHTEGARLMRKTDYAFWTFMLLAGTAGLTTV